MSNNNTKQINNGNNYSTASWLVPVLISSVISFGTLWVFRRNEKYNRSKWLEEVEKREKIAVEDDIVDGEDNSSETKPSVIEHFKSLELTSQSTILEANRRRTTSYYEKSREAHLQSLVLGISDYSTLLKRRQAVIDKLLSHYRAREKKSLRTVIIMVDISTQQILSEAREKILMPLFFSTDLYSRGVWIPEINIIPKQDMHVSVACPWWWHTMRDGNRELSQDLANRLRQTLVVDFHHPFEIELERFVFLGGKVLVALWRTVGERITEEDVTIIDRHATTIDPMVRLRREIVHCFTDEENAHNFLPLTHTHRKNTFKDLNVVQQNESHNSVFPPPIPPPKRHLERRHTIEMKSPGIGSGDGFIHTTLCRLPLECFSMNDIELEPIHRMCREASACYSGHRMLVHKFRFLETTGAGGDSNPCVKPLFDETMVAPLKFVTKGRGRTELMLNNAHTTGRVEAQNWAIAEKDADAAPDYETAGKRMEALFDPPK